MELVGYIKQLLRQRLNRVGGAVPNLDGAVAGDLGPLGRQAAAEWLVASVPGGGAALFTLDEWAAQYAALHPRTYRVLPAAGGSVLAEFPAPVAALVRGVVRLEAAADVRVTVATGSQNAPCALYLDGAPVRTGADTLVADLRLGAGEHLLEVLAHGTAVRVTLPADVAVRAAADRVPTPVWESVTSGYVDEQTGQVGVQLAWHNDPRVGGWVVLRRAVRDVAEVLEAAAPDGAGVFAVRLAGDATAALPLGAELLIWDLAVGLVLGATYDPDGDASAARPVPDAAGQPAQPAGVTTVRVRGREALDGTPVRTTTGDDYTAAWRGVVAQTGGLLPVQTLARSGAGGTVRWTDPAARIGDRLDYALRATGLFDPTAESALSDLRSVVVGDQSAPGPIALHDGYPAVTDGQAFVRFTTPTDADYRGVRVYYRFERTGTVEDADADGLAAADAFFEELPAADAGTHRWFVTLTSGEGAGQVRGVTGWTGGRLALDAPWATPPARFDAFALSADIAITTDTGLPATDDSFAFDVATFGEGAYHFRTYDRAGNEQRPVDGVTWVYAPDTDDQVTGGATSGRLRVVVTGGSADLYLTTTAPKALYPIVADVYEDDPDSPPIATVTFVEEDVTVGPGDEPAFDDRPLPLREVRRWWARFLDAEGNYTWATASADRDALPSAAVSVDDYRPDGQPLIVVAYDDDTDQVRIETPDGRDRTFSGLSGSGSVTYQVGVTLLDDATQEVALAVDQTRGPYRVEVTGGGVAVPAWEGPLHGRSSKAPVTAVRSQLNAAKDAADVWVRVTSPVDEPLGLRVRDSESDTAPVWTLCAGAADETPRYAPSGTEIAPDAWFAHPDGGTAQVLNDVALLRDQVRRIFVQAVGRDSGALSQWDTFGLSVMEKPWIESIDLVWSDVTEELTLTSVAGAFCQSAVFELSTDPDFQAVLSATHVAFADGQTQAVTFAPTGLYRSRVWYGRVTPRNGPLVGGSATGLPGQPQRDSVYVPAAAAGFTGLTAAGVLRVVVTNGTAAVHLKVTANSAAFPVTATIHRDDPDTASLIPTHIFSASGESIGPSDYAALGNQPLPEKAVARWYAKLVDAFNTVSWATVTADRDPVGGGSVAVDDYRADGKARVTVFYDDDTDTVSVVCPDGQRMTAAGLDGAGQVTYEVGTTPRTNLSVEAALAVSETRGPYRVELTGGGATTTLWEAPLHGRDPSAPITEVRSQLSAGKDTADVFVRVTAGTGEACRLWFRDSEAAGAVTWGLCQGSGDPTPRTVASGTELGPADWFTAGGQTRQALNDIALKRDQVTRIFVAAQAQSGAFGAWDTFGLSAAEIPWLESIDLGWEEAEGTLVARVVGGAFCASALVTVADNRDFVSSLPTQTVTLAPGQTQAVPFTPGAPRGKTWHLRVTPAGGASGGAPLGQPVFDATYVPPAVATLAPSGVSGRVRAVVSGATADVWVRVDGPSGTFPVEATIYEDDPTAAALATHTYTAPGQDAQLLTGRALPDKRQRAWYVKLVDNAGTISWAAGAADRDALPGARAVVDDYRADGKARITVFYDDDTDQVTVVCPDGQSAVHTPSPGGGSFAYVVGETFRTNVTTEAALTADAVRGPYQVTATGGGTTVALYQGPLHGPAAKPPVAQPRTTAGAAGTSDHIRVTVSSPTGEQVTLLYRDGNVDAPVTYWLCPASGNSAPRYVASGTEVDETAVFTDGTAFLTPFANVPRVRDTVRRFYVAAKGFSGVVGAWTLVALTASELPYLESLDITWDEAAERLRVRLVGGAYLASCVLDVSADPALLTQLPAQTVAIGPGEERTAIFDPGASARGKPWHVRARPFRSAGGAGTQGPASWDAVVVPPSVLDVPPQVSVVQLTAAEQAAFPAAYRDPRSAAVLRLDALDLGQGDTDAERRAGVRLYYQIKGEAAQWMPASTLPVAGTVDTPAGTRSRHVALSRTADDTRVSVWAVDADGAGLSSEVVTYVVDFDDRPTVTALETRVDPTSGQVTATGATDDDTLALTWQLDDAAPTTVDLRAAKTFTFAFPLGDGARRRLTVTPYARYDGAAATVPGEAVVRELARSPRAFVTFSSVDREGRASLKEVKAAFRMVPEPAVLASGTVAGQSASGLTLSASYAANLFASQGQAVFVVRVRSGETELQRRRVVSNGGTALAIEGAWDAGVTLTGATYEILGGSVFYRADQGAWLPARDVEYFLRTAVGRSLEFYAALNGCPPEAPRRTFVDEDTEPEIQTALWAYDPATQQLTFKPYGWDDDTKTCRVYARKGGWPTITPTDKFARVDPAYLRYEGPVDIAEVLLYSAPGTWYGIVVPVGSFNDPGAPEKYPRVSYVVPAASGGSGGGTPGGGGGTPGGGGTSTAQFTSQAVAAAGAANRVSWTVNSAAAGHSVRVRGYRVDQGAATAAVLGTVAASALQFDHTGLPARSVPGAGVQLTYRYALELLNGTGTVVDAEPSMDFTDWYDAGATTPTLSAASAGLAQGGSADEAESPPLCTSALVYRVFFTVANPNDTAYRIDIEVAADAGGSVFAPVTSGVSTAAGVWDDPQEGWYSVGGPVNSYRKYWVKLVRRSDEAVVGSAMTGQLALGLGQCLVQ